MENKTDSPIGPAEIISLGLLGLFLFLLAFQKQHWDTDIFWALKAGQWMAGHHEVPHTDPFSYTFSSKEWIDFTWGFQAVAHLFFTFLGGWTGLFILQVIVTGLTFTFIYLNLRLLLGGRVWPVIALLYLVLLCSVSRLFIRPHIFSYLFISLYLYLFTLYEQRGDKRYLLLLLPLQVLWVNIHSSFVLGIFIAGAYAAGALIDGLRTKGRAFRLTPELGALFVATLLLPLVSLINPYGLKLLVFPFIHQGGENTDALKHIAEWRRLPLKDLFLNFYPVPINFFAFKVLTLFTLGTFLLAGRRTKSAHVIILAGALYMALSHVRWLAQTAYFAAPVAAFNLSIALEAGRQGVYKKASQAVAAVMAVALLWNLLYLKDRTDFGLGLKAGAYPVGTVSFIKEKDLKGRIFNEYVFGGYLIYNDIPVFIDGRTPTVYSPYFFWTTRIADKEENWRRLVKEHGIDMALVKHGSKKCSMLWKDTEWVPVVFDDVSVLYLRKGTGKDGVISGWAIKSANPCSNSPRYKLPDDRESLEAMRRELERLARWTKDLAARPYRLLGLVYTELGLYDKAVEALERSIAIARAPFTYYDLGVALGKLKRHNEAISAFKEAVRGKNSFKKGYYGLGLAYYDLKDYPKAVRYLKRYAKLADDRTEPLAYRTLGLSCFKLKDYPCAEAYLKRAAFSEDDPQEAGSLYYYIGSSLFEMERLDEAAVYYRKAVEAVPGYAGVLRKLASDLEKSGDKRRHRMLMTLAGDIF